MSINKTLLNILLYKYLSAFHILSLDEINQIEIIVLKYTNLRGFWNI